MACKSSFVRNAGAYPWLKYNYLDYKSLYPDETENQIIQYGQ